MTEMNSVPSDDCSICPRNCFKNNNPSYCGPPLDVDISTICAHTGEEPVISGSKGICNIFFNNCNLSCIYCQNWQISKRLRRNADGINNLQSKIKSIISLLDSGCHALGFVSPSHQIKTVRTIITELGKQKRNPIFVYNTNSYDKPETIRSFEGIIDIWLPDFKYSDPQLAEHLSDAGDYPLVALKAIKEMYRLKGSALHLNDDMLAVSGIIVRHLVLPGYIENSIGVLRLLAEELSPRIHISLMSQYWPVPAVDSHPSLNRTLTQKEYQKVIDEMEKLGFINGWVQDVQSNKCYRPDFSKKSPFAT